MPDPGPDLPGSEKYIALHVRSAGFFQCRSEKIHADAPEDPSLSATPGAHRGNCSNKLIPDRERKRPAVP